MAAVTLLARLQRPSDPAGLAAFRVAFGLVALVSVIRFVLKGWVETLYLEPRLHFAYDGLEWVRALSPGGMYALFAIMGLAAACVALGVGTRRSALIFGLAFSYVELIDKTTYLNHYYLVSLFALLLVVVRTDGWVSFAAQKPSSVPAWHYGLLRFQAGVVYVFAGLAKIDSDWLLRAEPLKTWLFVYADTPVLGGLLAQPELAFAMSYAGALFDLTIPFWLSFRKSRPYAYAAAILFHASVGALFPIGMFPWIMLAVATLFFDPSWPRALFRRGTEFRPDSAGARGRLETALSVSLVGLYVTVQVGLPLRFLAYPGRVNWTEQGFRFAWRVMLMEKTGSVEYEVVTRSGRFEVDPREELTELQSRMLSTQPDMIHDYARVLAARFRQRGHTDVRVHARAFASLNGRPSAPLVDPSADLASEPRSWSHKAWITLAPEAAAARGHDASAEPRSARQ